MTHQEGQRHHIPGTRELEGQKYSKVPPFATDSCIAPMIARAWQILAATASITLNAMSTFLSILLDRPITEHKKKCTSERHF
jgi:hypothetical protein